jgi:hypothetical protein
MPTAEMRAGLCVLGQRIEKDLGVLKATPWKLLRLRYDPFLYGPVLEFARGETVFPTETDIWGPISGNPSGPTPDNLGREKRSPQQAAEEKAASKYQEIAHENGEKTLYDKAAVYYKVVCYPGSWLFEYWTYYPFDVGPLSPHPHDTEHVFVEVDKIWGRVVGVLAAAHVDMTPNNLYLTSVKNSETPELPLYVLVEQGKHGLAPDINHDGQFTPGIDVNVFSETSQVWGVRDSLSGSENHMLRYEASMTLGRHLHDAWASECFYSYFPSYQHDPALSEIKPVYKLLRFPPDPRPGLSKKCPRPGLSQPCADFELNSHSDFVNPKHIYKPWVFPFKEIRAGFVNIGAPRNASVEFAINVNKIPFPNAKRLPLPGRVAFEIFAGRTRSFRVDNLVTLSVTGSVQGISTYYGFQYEKSLSNLFGYFFGYMRHKDFFSLTAKDCGLGAIIGGPSTPSPSVCVVEGANEFRALIPAGLYFEAPGVLHGQNLMLQIGPAFAVPQGTAFFYLRISTTLWHNRGRQKFGNPPP